MSKSILIFFLFMFMIAWGSTTGINSGKSILKSPKNITALPGDAAVFQCIAVAETIDFFFNEIRADNSLNSGKGLTLSPVYSIRDTTVMRNFTVVAGASNNNSQIVCRVFNSSTFSWETSDIAVLLIQVEILQPPQNVINATVHDVVNFTCSAIAETIDFFVNGIRAAETVVADYDLIEQDVIQDDHSVVNRTLRVIVRHENNNVSITCRALATLDDNSFLVKTSDPAVLHIQGYTNETLNQLFGFNYFVLDDSKNCTPVVVNSIEPDSVITLISGEVTNITCTAKANELDFKVNGTLADHEMVSHSFNQYKQHGPNGSCIVQRKMMISGNIANNNSNITCYAKTPILCSNCGALFDESDTVLLLVQGPLAKVVNISYNLIVVNDNPLFVRIHWKAPFTLPGTHISGYYISIYNTDTNTATVLDNFTHSDTFFIWGRNKSECFGTFSAKVHAFNGFNGTESYLELDTPIPTPLVRRKSIMNFNNTAAIIAFEVDAQVDDIIPEYCDNVYPMYMNLTASYSDKASGGSIKSFTKSLVLKPSGVPGILTTETINAELCEYYNTTVIYSNGLVGSTTFDTTPILFVYVPDNTAPIITFICNLVEPIKIEKCQVYLYSKEEGIDTPYSVRNGTKQNNESENITVNLDNVDKGTYILEVTAIFVDSLDQPMIAFKNDNFTIGQGNRLSASIIIVASALIIHLVYEVF